LNYYFVRVANRETCAREVSLGREGRRRVLSGWERVDGLSRKAFVEPKRILL